MTIHIMATHIMATHIMATHIMTTHIMTTHIINSHLTITQFHLMGLEVDFYLSNYSKSETLGTPYAIFKTSGRFFRMSWSSWYAWKLPIINPG